MHTAVLLLLASLPSAAPGDVLDLVCFHEPRPYRLRLRLTRGGLPASAEHDEAVGRLFRYLDADGDGALDAGELARAPSARQFLQMLRGAVIEPDAAPSFADLGADPKGGKAAPGQLLDYYHRNGAGPLLLEWGWRTNPEDRLTNALFHHLDDNADEKLSREELAAAAAVLHPLDLDGDDLISARELDPNFFGGGFTFQPQFNFFQPPAFFVAPADEPAAAVARELVKRYDHDGDHRLRPSEIGLDKDVFARLDADGDGALDEKELAAWLDEPPDAELVVDLESVAEGVTVVPREGRPDAFPARRAHNGGMLLRLPDSQIEVFAAEGPEGGRSPGGAAYLDAFHALDRNGRGLLDAKDLFQDPFVLVGVSRLASRDGDGRLKEKDLREFVELQRDIIARFTLLTIADRGRSLFEFLDENHDGKLGLRELRSAWARLAPFDRDGDGRIDRKEVPRQFHIGVSRGRAVLSDRDSGPLGYGPAAQTAGRRRGPLWFRRMDRNGDGDVSPAEFLGSPEDFRRLDADGDGLIDADEAERADALLRKKGP